MPGISHHQSRDHESRIPVQLSEFERLPDSSFVRLPIVRALFASSDSTIWRRVKAGTLPAPVKLSPGITAWRVADLRKALAGGAQ